MAMSGLSRVRTELFELSVIQPLAPHPVQMNRQLGVIPAALHQRPELAAANLAQPQRPVLTSNRNE